MQLLAPARVSSFQDPIFVLKSLIRILIVATIAFLLISPMATLIALHVEAQLIDSLHFKSNGGILLSDNWNHEVSDTKSTSIMTGILNFAGPLWLVFWGFPLLMGIVDFRAINDAFSATRLHEVFVSGLVIGLVLSSAFFGGLIIVATMVAATLLVWGLLAPLRRSKFRP